MNDKLLKSNGRMVRLQGIPYRIYAFKLGARVLADAEPVIGNGQRINLMKTRSSLGMAIRKTIELGLFV